MRLGSSIVLSAFVISASAAAVTPPHLKQLPAAVLRQGPAPLALDKVGVGGVGRLWLPGGERGFHVERITTSGDGVVTRSGQVEGAGAAVVTLGADGGFARVTDGATVWFLEIRDGATYAIRAGAGGLALAADDDGALALEPAAAKAIRAASPAEKSSDSFVTIDVYHLYDEGFAARYPGGLLTTRLDHLVALANQAFVDSGVRAVLRSIGSRLVTGALDQAIAGNLAAMQAALQFGDPFAGLNLRSLRNSEGADLISFHRTHDMYVRGACGIAYLPSPLTDSTAVNVVDDGESLGSRCDDLVFTHEVGHNLGARHQSADDHTPGSSHAFHRPGQFYTVMGNFATGEPDRYLRLGLFSNPRMACGGMRCGIAGVADNAATLDGNRGAIAGIRSSQRSGGATPPAQSDPDSDGDGVRDRLDPFPFDAARSADRDGDGVADADDAFPDNSDESRDSDHGGLGDRADPDDDNDGYADVADLFPDDPRDHADADHDGVGDSQDAFPNQPREDRDSDGDGSGDRADADDDGDGTIDLGSGASLAESELLVTDDASDRVLRFRGSDLAALGTLAAFDAGRISTRSEMASAPDGGLWLAAGSTLWRLDRLRGTRRAFLDTYASPAFHAGFPLSPVVASADEIAFSELGSSQLAATEAWRSDQPRVFPLGSSEHKHLVQLSDGRIVAIDSALGNLTRYRYDLGDNARFVEELVVGSRAVGLARPGGAAAAADGTIYVVEDSDGSVRRIDAAGALTPLASLPISGGARAVAIGPDGVLYVALLAGGVQRIDRISGADLGMALTASAVAAPASLLWVPRVADGDLSAAASAPPASGADGSITPALGGAPPLAAPMPLTPCLEHCGGDSGGGGGGGGSPDPSWLVLAVLAAWRASASSARRPGASSPLPCS